MSSLLQEDEECWQLTVAYDGRAFWGSQRQAGRRTVQGELESALAPLTGREGGTVFAGRTDRGVHAVGQVVSIPAARSALTEARFQRAVNARLPADLSVVGVRRRPVGFHARYDARWREYRYRIWCGAPQPLASHLVWQRARRLDLPAMDAAANALLGRHDFAAYAGGGEGVPWSSRRERVHGTTRTLLRCSVRAVRPWWGIAEAGSGAFGGCEVRVAADGFLPRMVRAIVGALVEVGRGVRPADWTRELLAAADRRLGPPTAPAHGLVLWRVGYDDAEPEYDAVGPASNDT